MASATAAAGTPEPLNARCKPFPTVPVTRSGVESMAMGMRRSASSPFSRAIATRMSKAARKPIRSSGRGTLRVSRRPSTRSMAVPRGRLPGLTTGRSRAVTAATSSLPIPARRSVASKLSLRPMVAVVSNRGRSGASDSGSTRREFDRAVLPVAPPRASGAIACCAMASACAGVAGVRMVPTSAGTRAPSTSAIAHRLTQVPRPIHQLRLPMLSPRSTHKSSPASRRSGNGRQSLPATLRTLPVCPGMVPVVLA